MLEQLADLASGGRLSEMEKMVVDLGKTNEVLSRQVDNLTVNAESAFDTAWERRLGIDKMWSKVSGSSAGQSRYVNKNAVNLYANLASFMYQFNPLIRRAVDVKTLFTFSGSFQMVGSSDADQSSIDSMRKDLLNRQAFFSQQAIQEADAELQKSGNIFVAIWKNLSPPQIRVWPVEEISAIVLDDDDSSRPTYYIRTWTNRHRVTKTIAYPSIFNEDIEDTINVDNQSIEVDSNVSIYHMSSRKGIRQEWAITELSVAIHWARAHEGFLEDFAAIVAALRKYTHMFTTNGGKPQVQALGKQFAGDLKKPGTPLQSNPPGSMVVGSEGNEMKVVDAGAGKIVGAKDSRYFLIMVCAGTGVPETLLTGDPSTGNLATAKELTGPFLTLIESRQEDWSDTLSAILKAAFDFDDVEISFPPIRSQDALDYVTSLINAATLGQPGSFAGTVSIKSLISGLYESLDINLPDDERDLLIDSFNAALEASASENGELSESVDRLVAAVREMQQG